MTPTPNVLAAIYCLVCHLPPINDWKMPPLTDIAFRVEEKAVLDGQECYATYTYDEELDKHEILISSEMNTNFEMILTSLLHECIHMRRSKKNENWRKHDAVFKKYAKQICEEYGLTRIGF
jgi:hypothetical protein